MKISYKILRKLALTWPLAIAAGWIFLVDVAPSRLYATAVESLSTEELRELQARLNKRQSLSVRFTQTRTSSLRPKKPSKSSGKALFAKPAKFRWEIEQPSPDVLLFDGRALVNYKPGEKTATRFSAEAERAKEIKEVIDFVLDFDALLNRYAIKEAVRSGNVITMHLKPKAASAINELSIEIDAKSFFVSLIKMSFQNKNTSEFRFSDPSVAELSPGSFSVPEGYKVVEGV